MGKAVTAISPFRSWPDSDRDAWGKRVPAWTPKNAARVQREYGRLLAWLAVTGRPHRPLTEDVLLAYAQWLRQRSIAQQGFDRLSGLVVALLIVQPESGGLAGLRRVLDDWRREDAARRRGRPARPGNRAPRAARHSLADADWPAAERARWAAATRTGGKYSGGGPLSVYRPSTVDSLRQAYALWLGFLRRTGRDGAAPDREAVDGFAAELEARISAGSAATILGRLRRVLAALDPDTADAGLGRHARRLAGRHVPASKLPRLAHPGDLAAAGDRLIAAARAALRTTRAALDFRDGLLLRLLAERPVRIDNAATIRRDVELDLETPEGQLAWTAAQTKNRINLLLSLTPELVALIHEFWAHFRPLLANAVSGPYLWLAQDGRPLPVARLRAIINRRTEQLLGKRVPPHLFRDGLATLIAIERPERIDDVQALLGHKAPRSKDTYVALARAIVAQRRRQALEATARKASGRKRLRFKPPPHA